MSPNELGIYDMSGNLEELCSDYISEYLSIPQTNPNTIGRLGRKVYGYNMVLRGGSWIDDKSMCRVTSRSYVAGSKYFNPGVGLRLVIPAELQV
jgi:formylglycine-generating enzyme required for sulfatase activity